MAVVGAAYDTKFWALNDCLRVLVDLADISTGENILDLGCGTGTLAIMAAPLTTGQVYGIDLDQTQLAHARTKIPNTTSNVHFLAGDVVDMKTGPDPITFPNNVKFNVVFASKLLHDLAGEDIQPVQKMFNSIRPYLAPDARIVVDWTWKGSTTEGATAGGVIYDMATNEKFAKLQWTHPGMIGLCVRELSEKSQMLGLRVHKPIQLLLGDGQYMDARSGLPPFMRQKFQATLDKTSQPLFYFPGRWQHLEQDLGRFRHGIWSRVQSGSSLEKYVKEEMPPNEPDYRDWVLGHKWRTEVLPLYNNIIMLIRKTAAREPDWGTGGVSNLPLDYQVCGVFKYT